MDAYAALELRGHCAQGQTVPLYLSCRVNDREVVYQTKLAGRRSGLSTRELGVELLGTTIAHEIGLHVARPAMITLTEPILAAIEDEYRFGITDATAFGSVWKVGLTPFLSEVEVARLDPRESAMLVALDLILTNGDRTDPNPNVCWDRERLLVFDFEHCLELPQVSYPRRYQIHLDSLQPLFETHLAAPMVHPIELWHAVQTVLAGINIEAFERDSYALPQSWYDAWVDNIGYLGYIKKEPEAFLKRIGELGL